MAVKIISDRKWKNVIFGYELPENQRKEFKYIGERSFESHPFVKYRGNYYDLQEFMRLESSSAITFREWDGYHADSYFSGIVVKVSSNGERYKIGRYIITDTDY